jgi:O-antigen/teichoic acid export membrane protein
MIKNPVKYAFVEDALLTKTKIIDKVKSSPIIYRLAKGTYWSLLGTVATRIFTMITAIIVARLLGKENYGAYGMVQSTLGMFGLFAGFALGSTTTKYIAELREGNPEKAGGILSLTKMLSIISSSTIGLILIFLASWIARITLKREDLSPIIITGAFLMFISTLNNVQSGALAGFEAFKSTAKINFIQGIATPLISIPLVYYYGIQGAIISLIFVSAIGYWLCNIALKRECERYGINVLPFNLRSISEWPILWKYSIPALMSGLFFIPVTWITNAILVNQTNGYAELGLFNAANQWRQFIIFIPQILTSVMIPIFSETYSRTDRKDFADVYVLNLRLTWLIALPAATIVIALRNPLAALFGSQYSGMMPLIIILMATTFLNVVNNVAGAALAGSGKMWVSTLFNLCWAVVLVSACSVLAPLYGGLGLSLAYLLAYLFHTIWVSIYVQYRLLPSSASEQKKAFLFSLVVLIPACLLGYSNSLPRLLDISMVAIAFIPLYKYISGVVAEPTR